jgi:hypothetical protein
LQDDPQEIKLVGLWVIRLRLVWMWDIKTMTH